MRAILFLSILILMSAINIPSLNDVMNYITSISNNKIKIKTIKVWALEQYWEHELIPSVSQYLFEDIDMVENIAPEGNPNRPGDKHEKKYITVHDTGDFAFNAGRWSNHVYNAKIGNTPYEVSFQYVVGNDGYYHNIPDDETAYHAGDGAKAASLFQEYPTNVYGKVKKPHVSISTDGYYVIEGEKTIVKAPTDNDGKILTEEYFNDMGIYTTIKDGMYYIGNTWYSQTYNRIGNHGGNTNSIGIESCVNRGSDIYLTWQRLAKLVAKLMDEYNFEKDQIVQHHYFSGKDCPQTMRTEGYWDHFLSLVDAEYQMLQFKKMGFTFKLIPTSSAYVNELGRIINRSDNLTVDVSFIIIVTDPNGNDMKKVFTSAIPSKN